jgi:hypothetical protein
MPPAQVVVAAPNYAGRERSDTGRRTRPPPPARASHCVAAAAARARARARAAARRAHRIAHFNTRSSLSLDPAEITWLCVPLYEKQIPN